VRHASRHLITRAPLVLINSGRKCDRVQFCLDQPVVSGKCVRFGAGSYQDSVNWYCSPSYQAHVVRKSCRELTQKTNQLSKMKPDIVQNSVVALQDHCSYKAMPTNII